MNMVGKPENWSEMTPHQRYEWRKINGTNSTGFVGVKPTKGGKFTAKIFCPIRGKHVHLGTFDDAMIASKAYEKAFADIYGTEEEWLESNVAKLAVIPTKAAWIPFDRIKPTTNSNVLAWDGTSMVVAEMWDSGTLHDLRDMTEINATHWTPLPPPPEA